ncbi:UNVERIFIED_CONTAM: Glycine-rich RNA-binding protein 2, mitochondrial [Sesamum radiatum]|uniref:Glycine-rich RNA-binding protein 2, mitochondrial n=1 Tax=Sesamum radiatum TaxID=300843 RepID=A0AAW2NCC3_SESRA
MACYNKFGTLLRQSISASNALNGQSSMLNAIRCMSTKLFVGGLSYGTDDQSLRDAFSSLVMLLMRGYYRQREGFKGRDQGSLQPGSVRMDSIFLTKTFEHDTRLLTWCANEHGNRMVIASSRSPSSTSIIFTLDWVSSKVKVVIANNVLYNLPSICIGVGASEGLYRYGLLAVGPQGIMSVPVDSILQPI